MVKAICNFFPPLINNQINYNLDFKGTFVTKHRVEKKGNFFFKLFTLFTRLKHNCDNSEGHILLFPLNERPKAHSIPNTHIAEKTSVKHVVIEYKRTLHVLYYLIFFFLRITY